MSGLAKPSLLRANACALETPKVKAPRPVVSQRAISRPSRKPRDNSLIDTAFLTRCEMRMA